MQLIRLTQLQDFRQSVNIVNEGTTWVGMNVREPKVGEGYFIADIDDKYHRRGFVTENVIEILSESKFRTKNFLYLYEKIENDD